MLTTINTSHLSTEDRHVMGVMFEIFAVFLVSQKRVLINAIINTINGSTFSELLRAVLTVTSVRVIHEMRGIVMSLFLRFVSLEFSVFLSSFVSGLCVLPEASGVSVEIEVRSFIAFFVVVFFGPGVLIFVMRVLVTLDDVSLFVSLLDFLFEVVLS